MTPEQIRLYAKKLRIKCSICPDGYHESLKLNHNRLVLSANYEGKQEGLTGKPAWEVYTCMICGSSFNVPVREV